MKKRLPVDNLVLWGIAILSILLVFVMPNRYYQDVVIQTFLWAGLASAWNLYSGYCGRLSIGHAAYLGIGAYSSTILYVNYGISPWIGMLVGCVFSAIAALVIGGTTLRLKGTFFVLSTIAFAEILKTIAIVSKDLTAGSLGILIPYEPGFGNMIFAGKVPYAILIWLYMIGVIFLCVRLEKSKLGYSLIAVGENQEAAENLGVNSTQVMLKAYVASAMLTSVGGTLFAQYFSFIEPMSVMSLQYSINFILFAIAGGMGLAFGPMVGAFILMPITNLLRGSLAHISGLHGFLLGLLLILILLYRPDGLLPQFKEMFKKKRKVAKPGDSEKKDGSDSEKGGA